VNINEQTTSAATDTTSTPDAGISADGGYQPETDTAEDTAASANNGSGYESEATKLMCDPDSGYYYGPACEHSRDMDGTLEQQRQQGVEEGLIPDSANQPNDSNQQDYTAPSSPSDSTIEDRWSPDDAAPPATDENTSPDSGVQPDIYDRNASPDASIEPSTTPVINTPAPELDTATPELDTSSSDVDACCQPSIDS
jgi:hypothetical protein